jgi:hypothetical protein
MRAKDKKGKFIKTRLDKFCLDCDKPLVSYKAKRCGSCGAKHRLKKYPLLSGKKSIRYIDGRRIYRKLKILDYCRICKGKDNLCIHHKDEDRHNNKLNNLLVVCKSCHKRKFHPNKTFYGNQYTN